MSHEINERYDIRTNSGRLYNYAELGSGNLPTVHEIASHLSKEQRFGGATRDFYSVAQHAVLVSRVVEKMAGPFEALYALHHDDHEFLLKDIPSPLKNYIFDHAGHDIIGELEDTLDERIYNEMLQLEWPIPDYIAELIETADMAMFVTEGMALVRNFQAPPEVAAADITINPLSPPQAEQLFLQRHTQLITRRGRRVA